MSVDGPGQVVLSIDCKNYANELSGIEPTRADIRCLYYKCLRRTGWYKLRPCLAALRGERARQTHIHTPSNTYFILSLFTLYILFNQPPHHFDSTNQIISRPMDGRISLSLSRSLYSTLETSIRHFLFAHIRINTICRS